MPDTPLPTPQRIAARQAFRALPLERPERSAWPAVAARLQQRPRPRRRRRAALWWAVAASALLVAIWMPRPGSPVLEPGAQPPAASGVAASGHDPDLDALMQRSHALESRLRALPPALRSGGAVLAAQWIAADIAAIDAALAQAHPDEATALWQARVVLLAELAGLRHNEALAATGAGDPVLALD